MGYFHSYLLVGLIVSRICKNYQMDFNKTWQEEGERAKEESIKFLCGSR